MMLAHRMVGGASEHVRVLGDELKKRGWDVTVVANWNPDFSPAARSDFHDAGLRTFSINFPRMAASPRHSLDALSARAALLRLIHLEQPDVVHAHWRSILPYCLTPNSPATVFTKHLPGATDWLSNLTYRIPSRVIAISSELKSELVTAAHVPQNRVRLVVHGVDASFVDGKPCDKRDLRRRLGLPEDRIILVSVGRLCRQKDHCLTLEALRHVKALRPNVHLVIVGDGALRDEISQQIARLGLQRDVTLVGHAKPAPYLDSADIFVLSSLCEGFALAVVEAMMRGLPPIRTRGGGATDQIRPGVSGLLFNPGDAAELVRAIVLLIDNTRLRLSIAAEARECAQSRFAGSRMAEETESVYREVISESRAPVVG